MTPSVLPPRPAPRALRRHPPATKWTASRPSTHDHGTTMVRPSQRTITLRAERQVWAGPSRHECADHDEDVSPRSREGGPERHARADGSRPTRKTPHAKSGATTTISQLGILATLPSAGESRAPIGSYALVLTNQEVRARSVYTDQSASSSAMTCTSYLRSFRLRS